MRFVQITFRNKVKGYISYSSKATCGMVIKRLCCWIHRDLRELSLPANAQQSTKEQSSSFQNLDFASAEPGNKSWWKLLVSCSQPKQGKNAALTDVFANTEAVCTIVWIHSALWLCVTLYALTTWNVFFQMKSNPYFKCPIEEVSLVFKNA